MRRGLLLTMAGAIGLALTGALYADGQAVTVTAHEADRRVDITIGGQPFTSYIWPTTIKKPVLYPLRTAKGVVISRGYPLDPRPGERVDHPHHVGLWFNYGNVDGYDFWNNSDAIEAERQPHMGTIYHRAIRRATSGPEGILEIDADWVIPDGTVLLKENTTFVFRGTATTRTIDRTTTLTAAGKAVSLGDNKEGVIGLRVARQLEIPSNKPEVFTDASGKATDGADAQQRRRERRLPHERGQDRRRRVGHARKVVRAVRKDRRRPRVDCDLRFARESRLPDLLARTRLRPVRRQPARAEGSQQRQGPAEFLRSLPARARPSTTASSSSTGRRPRRRRKRRGKSGADTKCEMRSAKCQVE